MLANLKLYNYRLQFSNNPLRNLCRLLSNRCWVCKITDLEGSQFASPAPEGSPPPFFQEALFSHSSSCLFLNAFFPCWTPKPASPCLTRCICIGNVPRRSLTYLLRLCFVVSRYHLASMKLNLVGRRLICLVRHRLMEGTQGTCFKGARDHSFTMFQGPTLCWPQFAWHNKYLCYVPSCAQ